MIIQAKFAERVRPNIALRDVAMTLGGSLFLAVCSQIAIPFPFTPVPFALQCQAVFLVAYLLGPYRGFTAVCAWLLEGSLGMPVFAQGHFGLATLLGPTGGYLLSYLPVSLLVGYLSSRGYGESVGRSLGIFLLANVVVLGLGMLWLAMFVGLPAAWMLGVYPFVFGDFLKDVLLAVSRPLWRRAQAWLV